MEKIINYINILNTYLLLHKSDILFNKDIISDNLYLSIIYIFVINLFINLLHKYKIVLILIYIPGTIVHELMHLIYSFFLNGKPVNISIIPKFEKNRIILGSVSNENIRWYNAFLIGMAPLTGLFISYYYIEYYLSFNNKYVIFELLILSIIIKSSIPSITDIKLAIKYSYFLFFIIFIIFIIYINNIYNIYDFY